VNIKIKRDDFDSSQQTSSDSRSTQETFLADHATCEVCGQGKSVAVLDITVVGKGDSQIAACILCFAERKEGWKQIHAH
jgi:hypothetical protein